MDVGVARWVTRSDGVEGTILAGPLRGRSQRESAQGQLCAVGRETEGTRRQNVALAGHGLRDHRADSAAFGRAGIGSGLSDGE
jgi:hypothetical protein